MLRRNRPKERALIRAVDLCPPDGSTESLVRMASRITGRPISVIEKRLPRGGPSGVWVSLPGKDLIVLDTEGTRTRREAALCHEIGHVVLGHSPSDDNIANFFPDLEPAFVASLLRNVNTEAAGAKLMMFRCGYEDKQEQEAEKFATELLAALLESRNAVLSHQRNRFR